jgi:hypothetical protein
MTGRISDKKYLLEPNLKKMIEKFNKKKEKMVLHQKKKWMIVISLLNSGMFPNPISTKSFKEQYKFGLEVIKRFGGN